MNSASELARQEEEEEELVLDRTPAVIVAEIEATEKDAEDGFRRWSEGSTKIEALKKELMEVSRG